MKIGISSWSLPWAIGVPGFPKPSKPMGVMALLELAEEISAEVLQIADNLPLHTLSKSELRDLSTIAKEKAIGLEAGTKGLDPDILLRYLDIAEILGAKLVRTLPHDGNDRPDFCEAMCRLRMISRSYEAAGISLAIENHDFYPSLWLKHLVEEVNNPSIGVCLDAVNNLGLGESFREVLCNLGALTINFHCKDYVIKRKPSMLGFDVEGVPAGQGMLDLRLARDVLKSNISWIIESWLPWQGNIVKTTAVEKAWLLTGILNLRP